jgi:hypothetical protein
MSREVMQQALEALERYQVKRQDFDRFADEIAALRAALAEPAAPQDEPYLCVYEYDSPFGLNRSFYPGPWNGQQPNRIVPLYTSPPAAPTNKEEK